MPHYRFSTNVSQSAFNILGNVNNSLFYKLLVLHQQAVTGTVTVVGIDNQGRARTLVSTMVLGLGTVNEETGIRIGFGLWIRIEFGSRFKP